MLTLVEAEHRGHAVVEQVIADLKDQALVHFPSGEFNVNGAWTVIGALAHNLLRWTQLIGLPDTPVRAARTLRRWLLRVPGRLTRHARGWTLHLPARWPWQGDYIAALDRSEAPRRLSASAHFRGQAAGLRPDQARSPLREITTKRVRGTAEPPNTALTPRTTTSNRAQTS